MNAGIKSSISQGESKLIFLFSHNFRCLFTNILCFIDRKCQNEYRETFDITTNPTSIENWVVGQTEKQLTIYATVQKQQKSCQKHVATGNFFVHSM